MPVDETVRLLRNALAAAAANPKNFRLRSDAALVIAAIDREWIRRRIAGEPEEFFAWPSTDAPGGTGDLDGHSWLAEGPLSTLGYVVGNTNGLPLCLRRAILSRLLDGQIPPVFPLAYVAEWGEPATPKRLKKLAESLAAFARNAKRRQDERMSEAIRDWEADLRFLYDKYYVGRFHFGWPSADIS